ncbi:MULTISPECIES: helix-turn-helix transcriptional regulator [unclassified Spirillospora]|uniref:helix-turn-helix transcriptional regulator n=1 Tax=unclassified Spirillospora TaxID=2642701 RepID=UPI00371B2678
MRTNQPARRTTAADPDGRRAVLGGVSRGAVLDALRSARVPLPVADVAARVGLHRNTVRWHLDQLTEAGQVTRTTEIRHRPGRPRLLYTARPDAPVPPQGGGEPGGGYRLLADILAGHLADASPDPADAAGRAGRAWGGYLIGRPAPFTRLTPQQAAGRVTALLADLGFAPEPDPAGTGITLRACPFREVAEHHPDVTCAVHLGLMQGALAELGAPESAARLEPFVTPHTCRAHIEPEPAEGRTCTHD